MARDGTMWARMQKNLRSRLLSGTAVMVPLVITVAVLRWLFGWLSGFLTPAVKGFIQPDDLLRWFGPVFGGWLKMNSNVIAPMVAVALLLVLLYAVGVLVRRVVGKKLVLAGEALLMRIPLVRPIYSIAKQIVQAVSVPDRAAFKAVVLCHFPHPRMWAIGFLTGTIADQTGRKFCKVFIPTTPNPTTGFYQLSDAEELLLTDLAVDTAFKMLVSGGIISPEILHTRPLTVELLGATAPGPHPARAEDRAG